MPRRSKQIIVDTIVAQATAPGRGAVGIIRVSGPKVQGIAKAILGKTPSPQKACFSSFLGKGKAVIDQGIALFFAGPRSFTGEDMLELQAHGGPMVLDCLLRRALEVGARMAQPGEFSLRAFLNGKIDLSQAEAIEDLINATSEQAAHSALLSLQGGFSRKTHVFVERLIDLRTQIEAGIDFSDEEVAFPFKEKAGKWVLSLLRDIKNIQKKAKQGRLLREGISVVIVGKPNVGKSSLLNYFTGHDSAIVTNIPGTTRDVLREYINIKGLPLHIIDTAGLRESFDAIEKEGIKRTWREISLADFVILVTDNDDLDLAPYQEVLDKIVIVRNKIDLIKGRPHIETYQENDMVYISIKNQEGLDLLEKKLIDKVGYKDLNPGVFAARQRHIEALQEVETNLLGAKKHLQESAGDLLAEDLRQAQQALNGITGEFYADDLLERIFKNFCIGK